MNKSVFQLTLIVLSTLSVAPALGQFHNLYTPINVNYQGFLTDASGITSVALEVP